MHGINGLRKLFGLGPMNEAGADGVPAGGTTDAPPAAAPAATDTPPATTDAPASTEPTSLLGDAPPGDDAPKDDAPKDGEDGEKKKQDAAHDPPLTTDRGLWLTPGRDRASQRFWQDGQKKVERPPWTMRATTPEQPSPRQGSPSRP